MPAVRQTSFAAGELSPTLYGRSDISKYAAGLRRCKNFFISQHGAAVSRPGTSFVAEVKTSSKRVRLIPFVYSDTISYVLEFGDQYIRFFRAGAQLESGGSPYEIASPYVEADIPRLKYAQVGDVMWLTHPSYTPRILTRAGDTSWSLSPLSFAVRENLTKYAPRVLEPLPTADTTHPAKEWSWKVTTIGQDEAGLIFESAPQAVVESVADTATTVTTALPTNVAVYSDMPVTIVWSVPTSLPPGLYSPPYKVLGFRVYRGRGTLFGLIGETARTTEQFVDYGSEPDYSRPPPAGRNPFDVYEQGSSGAGSLVRTEEPTAVTFFEQRCVFGGTEERPERVWASQTNDYSNFDERVVSTADESVEFELASRRREEIRSMVGLERLLIFTSSAVWSVAGAGGEPLSPTSLVEARVQLEIGSSWLDPLTVADSALFVRAKGTGIRDLFYDLGRRIYTGSDLSLLAQHLFLGHTVVDWAYAEDPWSLVWVARSDGALLSLTYSRDQEVWAWAQHETDGIVENVCTVPETSEDAVYLVVRRTVGGGVSRRYIERMSSRVMALDDDGEPDVMSVVCLDCSVTASGTELTSVTGLDHLEGAEVYAVADGSVFGPLTVAGGSVELAIDGASTIHVGLSYTPELETLDLATDSKMRKVTVTKVAFELEASRGLQVGESFDQLSEWEQRQVSDSYGEVPLFSGVAEVLISNDWNTHGRAVVRQPDPLPVTVLGLTREVELGES